MYPASKSKCPVNVLMFFFSSRRRHTMSLCDWSSDVCSSDLARPHRPAPSWTRTQLGCLHDLPSLVMATQRFFCVVSATHTFQPGASTPGNSGKSPFRDRKSVV